MATFDFNAFLDALVTYLAANAVGGALAYTATPRAIWRYRAVEADATDPYSVVAPFGGELPWVPAARCPIQVMTTGKDPAAAHRRAGAIYGALVASNGQPKRMIDLSGNYRMLGVQLTQGGPKAIGLDANLRTQVVFNFDVVAANVA